MIGINSLKVFFLYKSGRGVFNDHLCAHTYLTTSTTTLFSVSCCSRKLLSNSRCSLQAQVQGDCSARIGAVGPSNQA